MKSFTSIATNTRKTILIFILLAGILTACAPGETSVNLQEETSTPEVVIEPTAALSAEEIREQRLNEITAVVEENENTFTIEELDTYLQEHGTNWTRSVQDFVDDYKGVRAPFQYAFIKNNYDESGILLFPSPYRYSTESTIRDNNSFPTPVVVDDSILGKVTESVYDHLYFKNSDGTLGWGREPYEYTVFIYITDSTNSKGGPINEYYFNIGGFTFIDSDENVKYISLEKIINHELTDEEMALFSDRVLRYIQEGYTVFTLNKSGNVNGAGSNFKELKTLMDAAMLEKEISAEE